MTVLKEVTRQADPSGSKCLHGAGCAMNAAAHGRSEGLAPPELANLAEMIATLDDLDNAALRATWKRTWNRPAPKSARKRFMTLGIAWRWQADLTGGFRPELARRLAVLEARGGDRLGGPDYSTADLAAAARPGLGARLIRDWRGERHEVRVTEKGYLTPVRTSQNGRTSGGCALSKGKLYAMLANPVVVGKIRHREKVYDGLHDAIISETTWGRVQAMLADNRRSHCNRSHARNPSPLAGRLFDPAGNRMRPVHTTKNGRRYRYYVSPALIDSGVEAGARGWRIPPMRSKPRWRGRSWAISNAPIRPASCSGTGPTQKR